MKKILFYIENNWSFGKIHNDLIKTFLPQCSYILHLSRIHQGNIKSLILTLIHLIVSYSVTNMSSLILI